MKKTKNKPRVLEEVCDTDAVCIKQKKKKKKCQIHPDAGTDACVKESSKTNSDNSTDNEQISIESKKKNTKGKKRKHLDDQCDINDNVQPIIKKKKHKTIVNDQEEIKINEQVNTDANSESLAEPTRSKKHKKKNTDESNCNAINTSTVDHVEMKQSKKKKKKKNCHNNDIENENGIEKSNERDNIEQVKIKKKKKKSKSNDPEEIVQIQENTDALIEQVKKKKHKKAQDTDLETSVLSDASEVRIEQSKTKKNKKKRKVEELAEQITTEENSSVQIEIVKQKKHKKNKSNVAVECNAQPQEIDSNNVDTEPVKKKKKHKKEKSNATTSDCDTETVVAGDIKGKQEKQQTKANNFSISPTDKSELKSSVNPTENTSTLGQWSTAKFDNGERQSKFFKLLGGFKGNADKASPASTPGSASKKGLYGSLFKSGPTVGGASMAMSGTQQASLHTALEEQFEKARSMSVNKAHGIGLGFSAPPGEGKKFHISTDKTSSKRFDD